MSKTNDLFSAMFRAHVKVYGIEAMLSTMHIPPARQLAAPGGNAAPEAVTSKAASEQPCALIAKVTINRIAGDHFTKLRNVLRSSSIEADAEIVTEVRPHILKNQEQRAYRAIGPHVMVQVDAQFEFGFKKAEEIAAGGLRIPALKDTPFAHVRWQMSDAGYLPNKDGIMTIILTPYRIPDFWKQIGYMPNGKVATVTKRNRRSMADGHLRFDGAEIGSVASFIYWEGGDGVIHEHPCTDVVVAVDTIVADKTTFQLRFPVRMVLGYVRMDGSDIANKILAMTDGAHVGNHRHINRIVQSVVPDFHGYREGDGIRMTVDATNYGQGKGHMVFHDLRHRSALILDTKQEFLRVDGRVVFNVMSDLHRPKIARLDPQMTINFRLAEGGFVEQYGATWINNIADKIGNPESLTEMFLSFMKDSDWMDTSDLINGGNGKDKTPWPLGENVMLSQRKMFVVAPDGEVAPFDYNLTDGHALNCWASPRLAKRAYRHLTERLMETGKGRIPVPGTEALRAYGMFDISIMDHVNPRYHGLGFYLSSGKLAAGQAVVFNQVYDDAGNPVYATKTRKVVGKDGYVSSHTSSTPKFEMVVGPACSNRQPSGWIAQMIRDLDLVNSPRYARMFSSPFIYFSCSLVEITDEVKADLTAIIGQKKLDAMLALWGAHVPFIVIANAVVGGGDLDDLHFVWIGGKVVVYLRGQKALVLSYPDEPLHLDATAVTGVSAGNRFAAKLKAAAAKAVPDAKYDRVSYYKELARISKGGLIAPLTNANLIWTERLNAGDPIEVVNMGGFNRHQEEIIDFEVKLGIDIGGGAKKAKDLFQAVTRVSRFLSVRIPQYLHVQYEEVDGAIDKALAAVNTLAAELTEAFEGEFLNPERVQWIDYVVECPVSFEADTLAQDLRERWNEVRTSVKEQVEEQLSNPRFDDVEAAEKVNFAIAQSVKQADDAVFGEVFERLFHSDRKLMLETAIAVYQTISAYKPQVDEKTGKMMPIPDAILYQPRFNTVLRDAIGYAKVRSMYPDAVDLKASADNGFTAARIPKQALVAVNGGLKTEEEWKGFLSKASHRAKVALRYFDENCAEDMADLGLVCPALAGRKLNACGIFLKDGSFYGWIKKEQLLSIARCMGKTMNGTLSRLINSTTGEPTPRSAQVLLDQVQ